MRILHIDTGRDMRGGQWQALYLHAGLLERGHESRLLCPRDGGLFAEATRRRLPVEPLSIPKLLGAAGHADLLHAHDAHAHTMSVWSRRPLVVSRRVAFPIRRSALSHWKYRQPVRFLAVSRFVRDILIDGGVPADRISIVYDGVPLPEESAGGEQIVAPYFADPQKGSDLLRAAADIAEVTVHFSQNLAADLPRAALFVYLTREEGLGSAALLAMAHRVPVLASRIGGLPEIVHDAETGVLTSNDATQIAMALRRLVKDADLRSRLGAKGRELVASMFTTDAMVGRTLSAYAEVAGC